MLINKVTYFIFGTLLFITVGCKKEHNENLEIQCVDDIIVKISSEDDGAIVTYKAPVAEINSKFKAKLIKGLASGEKFPVGTTRNTYEINNNKGNRMTCSFNVTVVKKQYLAKAPYFIKENPTPEGKKWVVVDELTDEFESTSEKIDSLQWNPDPYKEDRFSWIGRFPGLFESDNVKISNGELWLETEKFDKAKFVKGKEWTHGGAIVRSKALLFPGTYCETKMKTTETIMSGTFWMCTPDNNCKKFIKKELDVTESIGKRSYVTRQPELDWYENAAVDFRSGINATARQRKSKCLPAINEGKTVSDVLPENDFHTYGFFWESPTELHFYFDGVYAFSIDPPTPFNDDMAITMASETYDFNMPTDNPKNDGFNKPLKERSTRYKYVRTWKLVKK